MSADISGRISRKRGRYQTTFYDTSLFNCQNKQKHEIQGTTQKTRIIHYNDRTYQSLSTKTKRA